MSSGYMEAINGGLGTVSTIVETLGLDKQAHAEEEAAQAAALLALEQAAVDAARSRRSAARTIGAQRGQVARSGISLAGSQGDLLLTNAFELELDAVFIERFGHQMAEQENARAKSIAKAKQTGRVAGIIGSFRTNSSGGYGAYQSGGTKSVQSYSPSNPAPYGQGQGVLTREHGGGGGGPAKLGIGGY